MRSSKRARVFGLQTTPVSLCGRLKYLFFDNPISVIGWAGIASCSPNKTFKSGRRVYAVRTWFLLFRGPLLYRVQSPLRLRQSWQSAVVRQLYRLGSPERTNGSIGMRISRSGCKPSVMMKRLDCITAWCGITSLRLGGLWNTFKVWWLKEK